MDEYEANIREPDFRCHARIVGCHENPAWQTLVLSVSDGPESYTHFYPTLCLNEDGESPLTEAIAKAANGMIEEAQRQEAFCWINEHETVYVVTGYTGQQSWPVKAFLSEDRAHDLLRALNHWCMKRKLSRVDYEHPMHQLIIDPEGAVVRCPDDPKFRIEKTGVFYDIVEVPLDMFDPRTV